MGEIAVGAVIAMLFGHWVADFVCQPDWMSKQKSRKWGTLAWHAAIITSGMFVTALAIGAWYGRNPLGPFVFALVNGVGHFGIDAVTSRITGKLYAKGDTHNFFVVIGFDQFLHIALGVATLAWWVA